MDTDTISSGRPGAQMLTDNDESQLKDVNVKKSSASKRSQVGPNWRSVNCQLMIVNRFGDLFRITARKPFLFGSKTFLNSCKSLTLRIELM